MAADRATIALFDVDGTLIDSNYHHTIAWSRAFHSCDLSPPLWQIHRAIGMGGDHLVAAVSGDAAEHRHGDRLRAAWAEEYEKLLPEIGPFEGARDLLERVRANGHVIVLASSAPKDHLDRYVESLKAGDLIDEVTSADDADRTKPEPDLVEIARAKAGGGPAVMIGDSTWDVIAAKKVGVPTLAVRTGGFSIDELHGAGAIAVYDSLSELERDLDQTHLG